MTKDGRPRAFPSSAIDPYFGGAELRDIFAGQAMAALISKYSGTDWKNAIASIVRVSWEVADAMMAEREASAPDEP